MLKVRDVKRMIAFQKRAIENMEVGIDTIEHWCERNKNFTRQAYNDAVSFCAQHRNMPKHKDTMKKENYKINSKWKDICRVMCYSTNRAGCFFVKWDEWSELNTEQQEQKYFDFIVINCFAFEPMTYSIFDNLVKRFDLVSIHEIESLHFGDNFISLTEWFEKQKAKVN